MTHIADRTRPPLTGDERALLTGFLDFHRATPRRKCAELSAAAAHQVLPSPLISPVRVIAHLRWMEHFWCEVVLGGRPARAAAPRPNGGPSNPTPDPETVADTGTNPDTGFAVPEGATLEQVLDEYEQQCEVSRGILADLDLDHQVEWHDRPTSVRWVFLHLIEETARHNGHLDALHELISGAAGE